jgi:hypothetical protein
MPSNQLPNGSAHATFSLEAVSIIVQDRAEHYLRTAGYNCSVANEAAVLLETASDIYQELGIRNSTNGVALGL